MTIEEERNMVAAAASGDAAATERLYEQYKGLLVRASHREKVWIMWEDAMGAAEIAFLLAIRSYDPGRGVNFAAYAKSAVYAGVHQFFRRELRHWQHDVAILYQEDEEEPDILSGLADERDRIGEWEIREDLKGAFACLSDCERNVVELTFLLGLTQKRAAELLSVRIQTVNATRRRALRKLREFLAEGKEL